MPSYAITGASKGIGRSIVERLAATPTNTVLALVRDPESPVIKQVGLKHPNVYLIKGDVTDPASLLTAAKEAAKITGGSLDVFIHNSNAVDGASFAWAPSQFPFDVKEMEQAWDSVLRTAVYGGLWATNAFLPLIEKGTEKKIIHISSGMGDINLVRDTGLDNGLAYSAGKAAMNIILAKYGAELAPKGITALAISPGFVNTWEGPGPYPAAVKEWDDDLIRKAQGIAPGLKGKITPAESAKYVLDVIDKLEPSMNGAFVGHTGVYGTWF